MPQHNSTIWRQNVKDLLEAYDELIETLRWERDRIIETAEQLASEVDEGKAIKVLKAQADYIRQQAIR